MNEVKHTSPARVPVNFTAMLAVAGAFAAFVTFDQMYWWRLKPDYAFGWLVPLFVVYVVYDRWPQLRAVLRASGERPLPRWLAPLCNTVAGLTLAGGLGLFLLAALYKAGLGYTQPGSLVLAAGFSGVLLGMVYFNVPPGRVETAGTALAPLGIFGDAQLRAVSFFVFPALIWLLSAPLVSAVENAISLMLLRKVVTVVFTVFNLLGYPLVQEGNVLLLPRGTVGVADACSGIRSLTGCLFAGSFLAAVYLEKFWQKFLLVALAMGFAVITNLLRSLFLTAWAYAYGSEAIEGSLHDVTGFAVLGLTVAGLLALLPLFRRDNWERWLGVTSADNTPPPGPPAPVTKT